MITVYLLYYCWNVNYHRALALWFLNVLILSVYMWGYFCPAYIHYSNVSIPVRSGRYRRRQLHLEPLHPYQRMVTLWMRKKKMSLLCVWEKSKNYSTRRKEWATCGDQEYKKKVTKEKRIKVHVTIAKGWDILLQIVCLSKQPPLRNNKRRRLWKLLGTIPRVNPMKK